MRIDVVSYWKDANNTPLKELVTFQQVGLSDPRGVVVAGQDPDDRFMHLSTYTHVRDIPLSLPTALNPLTFTILPGFTQITQGEYDALLLAQRQSNPAYDPNDYI